VAFVWSSDKNVINHLPHLGSYFNIHSLRRVLVGPKKQFSDHLKATLRNLTSPQMSWNHWHQTYGMASGSLVLLPSSSTQITQQQMQIVKHTGMQTPPLLQMHCVLCSPACSYAPQISVTCKVAQHPCRIDGLFQQQSCQGKA